MISNYSIKLHSVPHKESSS
uniref:Uncharacterized protein n=1 Tax=Rhizophora mucronata TaxID=61149 RepID=A0A2P2P2Z7_RHIMU